MTRSAIRRAVASVFTHLRALFFAGVSGSITAIVAAYVLVYCVALPLFLVGRFLGAFGGATMTVGWIALAGFSLLAGLTVGTEVYIGVSLPKDRWNGPTPGWLRSLWAAAGALVGALPCAVMVDALLLGPTQALSHALNLAALLATARHLVGLGGLTGAMSGITMERFRIWRRPILDDLQPSSKHAGPPARQPDAAQVRAHPQPVLPVNQERVDLRAGLALLQAYPMPLLDLPQRNPADGRCPDPVPLVLRNVPLSAPQMVPLQRKASAPAEPNHGAVR